MRKYKRHNRRKQSKNKGYNKSQYIYTYLCHPLHISTHILKISNIITVAKRPTRKSEPNGTFPNNCLPNSITFNPPIIQFVMNKTNHKLTNIPHEIHQTEVISHNCKLYFINIAHIRYKFKYHFHSLSVQYRHQYSENSNKPSKYKYIPKRECKPSYRKIKLHKL